MLLPGAFWAHGASKMAILGASLLLCILQCFGVSEGMLPPGACRSSRASARRIVSCKGLCASSLCPQIPLVPAHIWGFPIFVVVSCLWYATGLGISPAIYRAQNPETPKSLKRSAPRMTGRRSLGQGKNPCVSKQCPADGVWRIGRGGSPEKVPKTRFYPLRELRWTRFYPLRKHLNSVQRMVSGGCCEGLFPDTVCWTRLRNTWKTNKQANT